MIKSNKTSNPLPDNIDLLDRIECSASTRSHLTKKLSILHSKCPGFRIRENTNMFFRSFMHCVVLNVYPGCGKEWFDLLEYAKTKKYEIRSRVEVTNSIFFNDIGLLKHILANKKLSISVSDIKLMPVEVANTYQNNKPSKFKVKYKVVKALPHGDCRFRVNLKDRHNHYIKNTDTGYAMANLITENKVAMNARYFENFDSTVKKLEEIKQNQSKPPWRWISYYSGFPKSLTCKSIDWITMAYLIDSTLISSIEIMVTPGETYEEPDFLSY